MARENTLCSIPFAGFYESTHDAALDYALEGLFQNDRGDVNQPAHEAAHAAVCWRTAHLAYAQLYCSALAHACKADWRFARLVSPRFYNFSTDEIDISLTPAELQRIFDEVAGTNWQAFLNLVTKRLAPRSGFAPFYSASVSDWGPLDEWDAPQASLLIEAYCDLHCDRETRDNWLIDDCNGELSDLLCDAMGDKASNIFALID